jgi:hypothetical protein
MGSADDSSFRIEMNDLDQRIDLVTVARHFGGRQWYFKCPATSEKASVLWRPLGANRFCSRKGWGDQVAYLSQLGTWVDRAHAGKAKVKARLLGDLDADEWALPPKPRGMRLRTYNRLADRYDAYQEKLEDGMRAFAARSCR